MKILISASSFCQVWIRNTLNFRPKLISIPSFTSFIFYFLFISFGFFVYFPVEALLHPIKFEYYFYYLLLKILGAKNTILFFSSLTQSHIPISFYFIQALINIFQEDIPEQVIDQLKEVGFFLYFFFSRRFRGHDASIEVNAFFSFSFLEKIVGNHGNYFLVVVLVFFSFFIIFLFNFFFQSNQRKHQKP